MRTLLFSWQLGQHHGCWCLVWARIKDGDGEGEEQGRQRWGSGPSRRCPRLRRSNPLRFSVRRRSSLGCVPLIGVWQQGPTTQRIRVAPIRTREKGEPHTRSWTNPDWAGMAIQVRVPDLTSTGTGMIFYLRVAPVPDPNWDEYRTGIFPHLWVTRRVPDTLLYI
jgi:hypothetical protein